MRILALADSDSYVKWAAALVGALPDGWERELLVVDSPIVVSDAQLAAALAGSGIADPARVAPAEVGARVAAAAPDVVLVATVGPIARVLLRIVAGLDPRPVLLSGLPGISIPATRKALAFRRQADLLVLHSRREVREFEALARERGIAQRFGLASLPFAHDAPADGTDLVFAGQAIVPAVRGDRIRVATMLRDAALADPHRRVVVKVRAVAGEQQTHAEEHTYPDLLAELGPLPANLVVSTEPMAAALDTAEGLVTISSTAAIEALARGIPAVLLDEFGISDALINTVFTGSGLFGGRDAVVRREFRHPDPAWLDDNYLHDATASDWFDRAIDLVAAQRAGRLQPHPAAQRVGGRLREAWDRKQAFGSADRSLGGLAALVVGLPARAVLRVTRRARARWACASAAESTSAARLAP